MTAAAAVSIVVVSRPKRARSLRRCVIALSQLRYEPFEIVVVADSQARSMLRELPQAAHIKAVSFDGPNISEARNIGIAHSDGDVIAFIEDNAIAEPSWLTNLVAPFQVDDVSAASGFVRSSNGFSWKWRAATIDNTGRTRPLRVNRSQTTLLTASPAQAVRSRAANMAVRRSVLVELEGFDPGYGQILGVADLNLRLAQGEATTAVAPLAQVHVGLDDGASEIPGATGGGPIESPDLFESGAAWALFLRRHCEPGRLKAVWRRVIRSERKRLVRHMLAGRMEPRDVRRHLRDLKAGFLDGQERRQKLLRPIPELGGGFLTFPSNRVESIVLSGHHRQSRRLRQEALQQVAAGRIVTVFRFSRSARNHRLYFSDQGYWEQAGGIFGRSERDQKRFRFWRFGSRVAAETERIRDLRLISARSR